MRRIIALVLTVLFSLQAAASAAVPGQVHGPNMQPLLSTIENTFVFALITGHASRYAATHAPAPTPMPLHPNVTPPAAYDYRSQPRTLRQGVEHAFPGAFARPSAGKASPDPLAMTISTNASAHRGDTIAALRQATRPPIARAKAGPTLHTMAVYSSSAAATTGVNPWWTYEEGAIPGIGKDMVNVANGNLLVQADDVDIPERGIDLAFRRTYNSQSQEGQANADGSGQGIYGEGWTNNFDERLAYDATNNVMSVFDLDGARYDYKANGSGGWTPPPGMQGTSLIPNSSADCYYFWTKKNGTTYLFIAPFATSCNPAADEAGWGRLAYIAGRNHNNLVQLYYSFANNDASSIDNLTQIRVADAGMNLYLGFTTVNGQPELATVTRPDGQVISYYYNGFNLAVVVRPGNATDDDTRTQTFTALSEVYGYYTGTHEMLYAASPRWVLSSGSDGDYRQYLYSTNTASGDVTEIDDVGYVNFTPHDGTSAPLQGGAQSYMNWRSEGFSGWGTGTTAFSDSQGHASAWTYDGSGRVTQMQAWSSPTASLITQASWDANNDLTATIDPRGASLGEPNPYETDYAYDTNGNTIAVAQPQVATSMGTFRPTALYSYDQFNNLTVYCDPVQTHTYGGDWIGTPGHPYSTGDNLCGAIAGSAYYTYYYSDANEPFGYPTDVYTPTGYHYTIAYSQAAEGGGDYGLPTDVVGGSIPQNYGPPAVPQSHVVYDAYGNVTSSSSAYGTSTITYDSSDSLTSMHRPIAVTDADGATTCAWYNSDGSAQAVESPSERAWKGNSGQCNPLLTPDTDAATYMYDADGNEVATTSHFGCVSGTTCTAGGTSYWYDGEDRMVEVSQPADPSIDGGQVGLTRYLYDLSQGGTSLSVGGSAAFAAHGNLYETERCIGSCSSWTAVEGNAYDSLNRSTLHFAYQPFGSLQTWTTNYDQGGFYGLPTSWIDPMLVQTTISNYSATGRPGTITFSDGTPSRTFGYDADGRTTSVLSSTFGADSYTYDADGNVSTYQEATGGSTTSPEQLQYTYYPNDWRASMSITAQAIPTGEQFQYSYRDDGLRTTLAVTNLPNAVTNLPNSFTWTYTNAGRMQTQSDPYTGTQLPANGGVAATTLQPLSNTFDAYGRLQSMTLPGTGVLSSMNYDPEGEMTSYSAAQANLINPSPYLAVAVNYGYNVRGYFTTEAVNQRILTGLVYSNDNATSNYPIDPKTGAGYASSPNSLFGNTPCAGSGTSVWDADARFSKTSWPSSCGGAQTDTYTYDAANHTTSDVVCNVPNAVNGCTTNSYGWGPSKMRLYSTTSVACSPAPCTLQQVTLHWDGDQVLFVTNSSGNLIQFNVESLASSTCGSGTPASCIISAVVIDRNSSGAAVDFHNGLGTFGMTPVPSLFFNPLGATGGFIIGRYPGDGAAAPSVGGLVQSPRADGYEIGYLTFQGVRAFSPLLGTWTTPDAFGGILEDPLTQRPYAWLGNNPVTNSDPSGFFTCNPSVSNCGSGGGGASAIFLDWGGPLGGGAGSTGITPQELIKRLQRLQLRTIAAVAARCPASGGGLTKAPKYSWSQVADDGQALADSGQTWNRAAYNGYIGTGGKYDFQRPNMPGYRKEANYAVGVFSNFAGLPMWAMNAGIHKKLADERHLELFAKDQEWSDFAYNWAATHCIHDPQIVPGV